MKWRSIVQVLFLIFIVVILVRFFPFVVQVGEMAALGLREFWWLILILALAFWLVWVLKKRNSG
jgi:hypothetical protein